MGPIDYTIGGNLPSPTQSFLQGIQVVDALKAREMAQQAQIDAQKAAEQKQAYQSQFMQKIMSGTVQPSDYEGLKMLDPANYKAWEGSIQQLGTAKKEAAISNMSPVYYGLSLGTPEGIATAKEKLSMQLTAAENSGDKQTADRVQGILASLETPEGRAQVMATAGATLNAIDPEAFKKLHENLMAVKGGDTELRQKSAVASKAESDAATAAAKAKFAESDAALELEKKGWDVKKIQSDIDVAKQNANINALQLSIAREGNDLRRQELGLKLDELRQKRDTTVREKAAEGESAVTSLKDTQALITDILSDKDTLLAAVGSSAWRGALPGTKTRTMAGKIDQLQNSLAAVNLDKLKGAMSDKDIMFIKNIASNLDRYQNEDAFVSELNRVSASLSRALNVVEGKYGLPKTPTGAAPGQPQTYTRPQGMTDDQWAAYVAAMQGGR